MRRKQSFIQSVGHAIRGLTITLREHRNFRFMTIIAVLVVIAGFWFRITRFEWALVWICISLVLSLELLNSALEETLDHLHPGQHKAVGRAKDIAAASVFLASVIACIAGFYIFLPRIFQ